MECKVWTAEDWLAREIGGGFSHESSERDLALMVSDFLESGGSAGAESWCSSDSDPGIPDLHQLADRIQFCRYSAIQNESELQSVVHSLILSIHEKDLQLVKTGPCNFSCVRFSLVKLLRLSGYDAAVCTARWQNAGKVPGGDHEYIDVINYTASGSSERLIIDIDFQSHFEIARAVESYDIILNSVPVVYVGSLSRLKQYLQVMVEAARGSLKQNSMPLPPWRSLAYLQAKWHSPYQRLIDPLEQNSSGFFFPDHKQCSGFLKRLQSAIKSESDGSNRKLKPKKNDSTRRLKLERRRPRAI